MCMCVCKKGRGEGDGGGGRVMVGEGRGGVKKRGAKKLDRGGQYADINHVQCSDLKHLRAVWGLAAVDDPTLRALEGEEEAEEGEGEEGEGEGEVLDTCTQYVQ